MLDSLLTDLSTESRRLLHGRGGHFAGLQHVAIDWFAPVLLITYYEDRRENEALQKQVLEAARAHPLITAVVAQQRHLPKSPKEIIYGELPDEPTAHENGLNYHLSLDQNQNHGFFLDMKPGRDWVRQNASGKRVLNLFAYTCSLSVAALAGDADSVTNLDMSGQALSVGRRNHQINFDSERCRRASYLAHDLFKTWGRLKRNGPFDLIIIDPPTNQAGSFVAEKDYAKIVRRLPDLSTPDSQILACLNSPYLDDSFLLDLFDEYMLIEKLPCASGFADQTPQRSLKALALQR